MQDAFQQLTAYQCLPCCFLHPIAGTIGDGPDLTTLGGVYDVSSAGTNVNQLD